MQSISVDTGVAVALMLAVNPSRGAAVLGVGKMAKQFECTNRCVYAISYVVKDDKGNSIARFWLWSEARRYVRETNPADGSVYKIVTSSRSV